MHVAQPSKLGAPEEQEVCHLCLVDFSISRYTLDDN